MKKISIVVLTTLFFLGCSDSIDNVETPVSQDSQININFSLKGASATVASVTGVLSSQTHDDINITFAISGETASHYIEHVQSGEWTLTVNAYKAGGNIAANLIHTGQQQVSIIAGDQTAVNLILNQTTGHIGFFVSWGKSASVHLNVNLIGTPGSVNTYEYSLVREGFNSANGSMNKAGTSIKTEIHDLKDGIWNLTVRAKNGASVVASGTAAIELMNGLVTKVNAVYNANGPQVDLTTSFDTESGFADRVYVGDEGLRNYLIVKHGFADLKEPYILKSDAEAVKSLELSNIEISVFSIDKGTSNTLNTNALSAFINLEELIIFGFNTKFVELKNHNKLTIFAFFTSFAEYIDLSGAPNLREIFLNQVGVGWVDATAATNLENLEVNGGECQECGKNKGGPSFNLSYGLRIGSIYVDDALIGNYDVLDDDYYKFVPASIDTISKTMIPDNDGFRILLQLDFTILKGYYAVDDELNNIVEFDYYSPNSYFNKGIGGPFTTFKSIQSLEVLKLMPNLYYLYLEDIDFFEIDLSQNTELMQLDISGCNFFTDLDISGLSELGNDYYKTSRKAKRQSKEGYPVSLYISGNYSLETITTGTHDYIQAVSVHDNFNLSTFSISGMSDLHDVNAYKNALTSMTFNEFGDYYVIDLSRNKLATISLKNLTQLQYLNLSENELTSVTLDSLPILYDLDLDNNLLTAINLIKFETNNLHYLDAQNNQLTTIDLTNLNSLVDLFMFNNDLQPTLDIRPIGAINSVTMSSNPNLDTLFYDSSIQNVNNISADTSTVLFDLIPVKN